MAPSKVIAATSPFHVPVPPPRRAERTLRVLTWVAASALAGALAGLVLWPMYLGEDAPTCGPLLVEMTTPDDLCSTLLDTPGTELVVLAAVSAGALAAAVTARSLQARRERRWRRELAATRR